MQSTGRSTHIIVTCPDEGCDGTLFFWPEARTADGDVVADCCTCTRRFTLNGGRLSELGDSDRVVIELA